MAKYLLDTNVPSELTKPTPDRRVLSWMTARVEDELCLSVVSLAEFSRGIERLPPGRKQTAFRAWLAALVARFDRRMLAVTPEIALMAGELEAASSSAGHTIEFADSLIAATARVHGLVLVTRNVRDFKQLPIQLLDPWSMP